MSFKGAGYLSQFETKTKFFEDGIHYDGLSLEEKERFEEDFAEDEGRMPDFQLNSFVFNPSTVDLVLQDLMTKGIKMAGGNRP